MLALRGSYGVGIEGAIVGARICSWTRFSVLGDTCPSIYYTKHSVASSNTTYRENEARSLQSSLWRLPGPQEGLGRGRLRFQWAKGRVWSKIDEKVKVLRMEFSIMERLSGPQESIFAYLEAIKSILVKNQKSI